MLIHTNSCRYMLGQAPVQIPCMVSPPVPADQVCVNAMVCKQQRTVCVLQEAALDGAVKLQEAGSAGAHTSGGILDEQAVHKGHKQPGQEGPSFAQAAAICKGLKWFGGRPFTDHRDRCTTGCIGKVSTTRSCSKLLMLDCPMVAASYVL